MTDLVLPRSASGYVSGQASDEPAVLADWFASSEELQQQTNKISLYASMFHNVDTADQAAAKNDRAMPILQHGLHAMIPGAPTR